MSHYSGRAGRHRAQDHKEPKAQARRDQPRPEDLRRDGSHHCRPREGARNADQGKEACESLTLLCCQSEEK